MTEKEHFIQQWLEKHPNDERSDAVEAWKLEVKYIKSYCDWEEKFYTY